VQNNAAQNQSSDKTTVENLKGTNICFNCHKAGHFARDKICCKYCKEPGHTSESCQKRIKRVQQQNKQSGNGQGPSPAK
jgi:hypothetical protein